MYSAQVMWSSNLICANMSVPRHFTIASSRHWLIRAFNFVSLFGYKIWWMISGFGTSGSEAPVETQMLLLEFNRESLRVLKGSKNPFVFQLRN